MRAKTIKMFRIEHSKHKVGPFQYEERKSAIHSHENIGEEERARRLRAADWRVESYFDNRLDLDNRHCLPYDCGMDGFTQCHVFGCLTANSLLDWFGPILKELKILGYQLKIFEANLDDEFCLENEFYPVVMIANNKCQVAMNTDKAKLIGTFELTEEQVILNA